MVDVVSVGEGEIGRCLNAPKKMIVSDAIASSLLFLVVITAIVSPIAKDAHEGGRGRRDAFCCFQNRLLMRFDDARWDVGAL